MNVHIDKTVRVSSLRELVRDNLVVLKYRLRPGGPPPGPSHTLICTCSVCGWSGPDPVYTDTLDAFNPPRGDIPRCRDCGACSLTFWLEDLSCPQKTRVSR